MEKSSLELRRAHMLLIGTGTRDALRVVSSFEFPDKALERNARVGQAPFASVVNEEFPVNSPSVSPLFY